jgi:flagellar basal body-associated protein FliL
MEDHGESGIQMRDVVVGFVLTTVAFMGLTVWLFSGNKEKPKSEEPPEG